MRGRDPIGRDTELSVLERALSDVLSGLKRAVVIRGEPGMGKSTLLDWALHLAETRGFVRCVVRSPALGAVAALFPLNEIVGSFSGGDLSENVEPPESGGSGAQMSFSPESRLDVLGLVKIVDGASLHGPVAILIDDIHRSSEAALPILYAALKLTESPVLLVTTVRTGIPPATKVHFPSPSADFSVDYLDLTALSYDSISLLASEVIGGPVAPSLVDRLLGRTLGNPLFATEMLQSWIRAGAVVLGAGGLWTLDDTAPDSRSLLEMISARLRELTLPALQAATDLAVVSRPLLPDQLIELAESSQDLVEDALIELEEAGIVAREVNLGTYQLSHPLFQAALIDGLSETRRAQIHGRVFRWLSSSGSSSAAETAYHATRALRRPNELLQCLKSAAEEAERVGSYAQAAEWYGRIVVEAQDESMLAFGLAGQAHAAEHFDPELAIDIYGRALALEAPENRARLLLGRARAWRIAGVPEKSLSDLDEAGRLARGELLFEIRDATAVLHAVFGNWERAANIFAALALDSVGLPIHARVLEHLATAAYFQGHVREACRLSKEAEVAFGSESPRYLRMNRGWFLTLSGDWDEASVLLREGIESARHANDLWVLIPLLTSAAVLSVWKGELHVALDLGTQAVRLTEEAFPMDRLGALAALGLALFENGAVSDAAQLLRRAPDLVNSSPEKNEVQQSLLILGECLLDLGDIGGARAALMKLSETLTFNLSWKTAADRLQSQILLAEGRISDALRVADQILASDVEIPFERATLHDVLARGLRAAGRESEAKWHGQQALEIYGSLGSERRHQSILSFMKQLSQLKRGRPKSGLASGLTRRETEILHQIANGKTNKEIASALFISPGTVKKHIENIRTKTSAKRRTDLVSIGLNLLKERLSQNAYLLVDSHYSRDQTRASQ